MFSVSERMKGPSQTWRGSLYGFPKYVLLKMEKMNEYDLYPQGLIPMQAVVQTRLCTSIRGPVQNRNLSDSLSAFVFAGQKWKSSIWLCARKMQFFGWTEVELGFALIENWQLGLYQWCFCLKDNQPDPNWLLKWTFFFYFKWSCLPTAELKGQCRVWCNAVP